MKKLLLALLTVLLFAALTLSVSAQPSASASIGALTGERGEQVSLVVHLSDCAAAKSMYICPLYDTQALELVKGEWLLKGFVLSDWDPKTQDGAIAYSSLTDLNGDVMKLTFRIREDAVEKTYPIGCEVVVKNGQVEYPVSLSKGSIHVSGASACAHQYGDWQKFDSAKHRRVCRKCSNEQYAAHGFDQRLATQTYLQTAANCASPATYRFSCVCTEGGRETFAAGDVNASVHTGETECRDRLKPTPEKDGYTGDTYCKGCGTLLKKGVPVAAGGTLPAENDETASSQTHEKPTKEQQQHPKGEPKGHPKYQPKKGVETGVSALPMQILAAIVAVAGVTAGVVLAYKYRRRRAQEAP